MATTPGELLLLDAARDALEAMAGVEFWYPPDPADACYVVDIPELKHLGEFQVGYLVHPGDVIYQVDTSCKFLVSGDFLVTAVRRYGAPELPWETGHVTLPDQRLKLAQDVAIALNGKELVPAAGDRTAIVALVANRNLQLGVDGWAIAQVQLSFSFSEVLG